MNRAQRRRAAKVESSLFEFMQYREGATSEADCVRRAGPTACASFDDAVIEFWSFVEGGEITEHDDVFMLYEVGYRSRGVDRFFPTRQIRMASQACFDPECVGHRREGAGALH